MTPEQFELKRTMIDEDYSWDRDKQETCFDEDDTHTSEKEATNV